MPDNEFPTYEKADTILVVDDSLINRSVLANIFEREYKIEEAENGQEALDAILDHTNKIAAILLDVMMPIMGGMELLERLKELDLLSEIPVFLITAELNADSTKTAYELGVMDVIYKPVAPHIVERRVNSIIELFESRKELSGELRKKQQELYEKTKRIAELSVSVADSLSAAIESRSGETGEHVSRIRELTRIILTETELGKDIPESEIQLISLGATMHDIGKIAIPDHILNKPGRLTPEEFEIMKSHTTEGGKILKPQVGQNEVFKYAYDIALHHHERWDGRGYPDGLKGDEISLWSQVVSIADVYDALVSDRCYKKAYSYDKACEMIKNNECGVFNPKLIECFFKIEPRIRKMYIASRASEAKKS